MHKEMDSPYESTRHAKFLLSYHLIWCPKYRRAIFDREDVVSVARVAINERVAEIGCNLIALEIMPDHVHLSLSAPPRLSPSGLAVKIKGGAGSTLAARFPELKKKGHIWSRSYFCATTGTVSAEVIKQYIESQWSRIT
jgi:putative transposase